MNAVKVEQLSFNYKNQPSLISNLFEIVIFSEKRIFILHIFHIRFQL